MELNSFLLRSNTLLLSSERFSFNGCDSSVTSMTLKSFLQLKNVYNIDNRKSQHLTYVIYSWEVK